MGFPGMEIILMRHGKPILAKWGWITAAEMHGWIGHYDRSEVERHGVPIASLKLANLARFVVASTAPRALSSVAALGHAASVVDAAFCEAPLPHASWRFTRLPPFAWAALFRLAWLFGYARGCDSVEVTKIRARTAARKLIALAERGGVLLVGHGIMNRLIARELVALGWTGAAKHQSQYWSSSVYVRSA